MSGRTTRKTRSGGPRRPGDPLAPELVKALRHRHGLSQDEMARRLGLKGGKSVISGWETGHTTCEGPVAELLLLLFGDQAGSAALTSLIADAEAIWKRAGNFVESWRQITAVPESAVEIQRDIFAKLFPGSEIPPEEHSHGFPFLHFKSPPEVYGISRDRWTGTIPPLDRPPQYLWMLQRRGEFLYRERIFEGDPMSPTQGHLHIASLFHLALPATFFLARLAKRCGFDATVRYRLHLDLEGMKGLGLVAYRPARTAGDLVLDQPGQLSAESHLQAATTLTVGEIEADPLGTALALVYEITSLLRPDLADRSALEDQLRRQHCADKDGSIRYLGFLDSRFPLAGSRRAIVSLSGVRVGLLEETARGSRFTYDRAYVGRKGALPLSPTLPLDEEPYESGGLHPFFANLLPEGGRLETIARNLKLDSGDRFGVLLATGADLVGAVEVRPPAQPEEL